MTDDRADGPAHPAGVELSLRELADRSNDAFWIASGEDGRLLYANPACLRLLGRTLDELISQPRLWLDAVHPEDLDRVVAARRGLLEGGRYEESFRVMVPDGTVRWVLDRGQLIPARNGAPPRLAGYATDITAFKRATESSRVLASAVEQARDCVFVTTLDGSSEPIIVFANSAFTTLTGYQESEVLGRAPNLFEGPRSDPAVLQRLRHQMGRLESFSGEVVSYRRDGSAFLAHWEVGPVRDESGRATHSVTTLRDITARKRAQAELLEAKAIAEAADLSKSAFLASMSHELRTPLNAIIGFSELLSEHAGGSLSERQGKYVQNVLSAGRSLLDLIDQVLDLTRLDVGRMVLNPTRFDLAEPLHQAHSLVRALADRKHLAIRIDVPMGFPPVRADARKVKQIVYSLLSHAIRTSAEGGTIRLSVHSLVQEGVNWFEILVVCNRAETVAMPLPDLLVDPEREPVFGAEHPQSGIGLGLSRKLVELHGGRIAAEAGADGGVTYRISLPRDGAPQPAPVAAPLEEDGRHTGPLVLVVEDNPDASDLLALYLSEAGYSVARAFTGQEGIQRARSLRPAAITMDSELPDVGGVEVLERLREDPGTSAIPCVVVSVVDRQTLPHPAGASAWLVKPIDRQQFLHVLQRAIEQATVAAEPA